MSTHAPYILPDDTRSLHDFSRELKSCADWVCDKDSKDHSIVLEKHAFGFYRKIYIKDLSLGLIARIKFFCGLGPYGFDTLITHIQTTATQIINQNAKWINECLSHYSQHEWSTRSDMVNISGICHRLIRINRIQKFSRKLCKQLKKNHPLSTVQKIIHVVISLLRKLVSCLCKQKIATIPSKGAIQAIVLKGYDTPKPLVEGFQHSIRPRPHETHGEMYHCITSAKYIDPVEFNLERQRSKDWHLSYAPCLYGCELLNESKKTEFTQLIQPLFLSRLEQKEALELKSYSEESRERLCKLNALMSYLDKACEEHPLSFL